MNFTFLFSHNLLAKTIIIEEEFKLWNIKYLHTLPLEEGVPVGGGSSNHYA
jgi:hypothetical protein